MVKVSLRPITPENLDECISLKVANHQKGFVDSNIYSLARAAVSPTYHPFGIYDADAHYQANPSMVGFVMYGLSNARGFINENPVRSCAIHCALTCGFKVAVNLYSKIRKYIYSSSVNKIHPRWRGFLTSQHYSV